MNKKPKGKANQQTTTRALRREIVAKMYKRGYTEAQIRVTVKEQLCLKTYSSQTVHADIVAIRKEWLDQRIDDVEIGVRIELKRIDDIINELWQAWEKSKTDYKTKGRKQKGVMTEGKTTPEVKAVEQKEEDVICFGDPRYLAEIGKQLIERRKLLGLYQPDKHEVTGKDGKPLHPEPITIEIIDRREQVDAKDTDN